MEEYQMELVLSLIDLLESPCHYGRPSKAKNPLLLTPQTKFDGTFVKDTIPLEDKN